MAFMRLWYFSRFYMDCLPLPAPSLCSNQLSNHIERDSTVIWIKFLINILQSIGSTDPIEFFLPLCMMMWSFVAMFCICETGQNVSNQFSKLSEDILKCDWYWLPHKLQRMFIIIMINAQEPVFIRGFGNIKCTRTSFKQVNIFVWKNHEFSSHFEI